MLDPQDVTLERIASTLHCSTICSNSMFMISVQSSTLRSVPTATSDTTATAVVHATRTSPTSSRASRVASFTSSRAVRLPPISWTRPSGILCASFVPSLRRRPEAAVLLWNSLPAHWIVRVAEAHRDGLCFWEETIRHFTHGAFGTTAYRSKHHIFRVFSFGSPASTAAV